MMKRSAIAFALMLFQIGTVGWAKDVEYRLERYGSILVVMRVQSLQHEPFTVNDLRTLVTHPRQSTQLGQFYQWIHHYSGNQKATADLFDFWYYLATSKTREINASHLTKNFISKADIEAFSRADQVKPIFIFQEDRAEDYAYLMKIDRDGGSYRPVDLEELQLLETTHSHVGTVIKTKLEEMLGIEALSKFVEFMAQAQDNMVSDRDMEDFVKFYHLEKNLTSTDLGFLNIMKDHHKLYRRVMRSPAGR